MLNKQFVCSEMKSVAFNDSICADLLLDEGFGTFVLEPGSRSQL